MDNLNRRRNLGFFFDQAIARAPDKVAIIDLFGGQERRATYRQLDRADGCRGAHAGAARRARGRARRHAGREPHRVHRILLRIDARRRDPASAQHAACRRHARAHHRRCRLRAGDRRPFESPRRCCDRRAPAVAPPAAARPARARLSRVRRGDGKALAAGRPASDRGRCPGLPALYVRVDRPAQGRDHDASRHALVRRLQPALLAVLRERSRARRTAALSQERAARHGEADALCRRLLRADAGLRAARLSRGAGQVQVHLFARRRGGVHDVSPASRLSAHARSERPARHDHRIGGGDPRASRCGRARASARQGLGKLRVDRRRQPAARADRRPSGPARQPGRSGARDRAQAGRRRRAATPRKASC